MRTLSKATTGLMIAGAALFVAACGGGAANNTANAPAMDNGTMMSNDTMAPDMNAPMPADGNMTSNTTTTTMTPGGNTSTTMTSNTANGM